MEIHAYNSNYTYTEPTKNVSFLVGGISWSKCAVRVQAAQGGQGVIQVRNAACQNGTTVK